MTSNTITINTPVRFLMPDANRQQGVVVGFIQRNDDTKLCINVTTGADKGRTVYLSEDWVIGVGE